MGKRKIFLIIVITVMVIILAYLGVSWHNYSHEQVINLEDMSSISLEGKDLNSPKDLSQILEEARQTLDDGRVNPRFRIYYHGQEVAYLDHLGNIGGIGNLTMSGDTSYGFFDYLGDSTTEIVTGWFNNIYVSNTVNTTKVNTSKVCDSNNCYSPDELNISCGEGGCGGVFYWNNGSSLNETGIIEGVNTSANIQANTNGTNTYFSSVNISAGNLTIGGAVIYWNGSDLIIT